MILTLGTNLGWKIVLVLASQTGGKMTREPGMVLIHVYTQHQQARLSPTKQPPSHFCKVNSPWFSNDACPLENCVQSEWKYVCMFTVAESAIRCSLQGGWHGAGDQHKPHVVVWCHLHCGPVVSDKRHHLQPTTSHKLACTSSSQPGESPALANQASLSSAFESIHFIMHSVLLLAFESIHFIVHSVLLLAFVSIHFVAHSILLLQFVSIHFVVHSVLLLAAELPKFCALNFWY